MKKQVGRKQMTGREEKIRGLEREQEVLRLLGDHGYSDPNTKKLREHMVRTVLNTSLQSMGLVDAVTFTVRPLQSTTTTPLEVADLICAFAVMRPDQIANILQGARQVWAPSHGRIDDRSARHAEGLALGAFEAVNVVAVDHREATKWMMTFLGYTLGGKLWLDDRCVYTSHANGRMSQALSLFTSGIWASTEQSRFRLEQLATLPGCIISNLKGAADIPRNLHDYLIDELCAKIFLAAPTHYRLEILRKGLVETIKGLPPIVVTMQATA